MTCAQPRWTGPTRPCGTPTLPDEPLGKGPHASSASPASAPAHRARQRLLGHGRAGLTLLAGCAEEEPEPKFDTEPSVKPSGTAAAEGTDKETVKEFLVRWAEVESEMQNTGRTEEYLALSPGCEPCESFADNVEEIYANDGFIRTKAMSIDKVQRVKGTKHQYFVWGTLPPTVYRNSPTEAEDSYEGGPQKYLFGVRRSSGALGVIGMARTPM